MALGWVWIERAVGVLVFMASAVTSLGLLQHRAHAGLALTLPLACGGLALWLHARGQLRRRETRRVFSRIEAALDPAGRSRTVPLHLVKWMLWLGLLLSLLAGACAWLVSAVLARDTGMAAFAGAAASFVGLGAWGVLRLGVSALRAGGALHVDGEGIRHCQLGTIAWEEVRGVDLHMRMGGSIVTWYLEISLQPQALQRVAPSLWRRLTDWQYPAVGARGATVRIPLWLLREDPDALLAAVRTIGARTGAPVQAGAWFGAQHGLAFQRARLAKRARS